METIQFKFLIISRFLFFASFLYHIVFKPIAAIILFVFFSLFSKQWHAYYGHMPVHPFHSIHSCVHFSFSFFSLLFSKRYFIFFFCFCLFFYSIWLHTVTLFLLLMSHCVWVCARGTVKGIASHIHASEGIV